MTIVSLAMLFWMCWTVAVCWLTPESLQLNSIALMSALFLGWYSPLSLCFLFLVAVVSFLAVHYHAKMRCLPALSVSCIAILLIALKSHLFTAHDKVSELVVPLGLSYYTLRAIHYCIDGWKQPLHRHTFSEYLTFLFFLPTLLAGPITRFQEFQRGTLRRRWDPLLFSMGCERILYGYVKIVFLATYLVSLKMASVISGLAPDSRFGAWLDCLRYGLNLYFQFSGYSDVAIGFALLLGFRISENFNYPFLARNIGEFWQRWHISLTNWCRDYIYLPALSVTRRPYVAILVSMIVLGLWHELSLRYIVWGVYHCAGIALWRGFQRIKARLSLPGGILAQRITTVAAVLVTLNFVILSFAITKEASMQKSLSVYATLFGWGIK